ncbi:MAG: hypothetical protein ACI4NM_07475 [Bullifex sp.]
MKKTLSILLVVLLATTSLFAGVNLKGRIGFGHKVYFDGTVAAGDYLGDGSAVNGGRLQVLVDSDYASGEIRNGGLRDQITGIATIKVSNILNDAFGLSLPVSVNVYGGNQSFSTSYNWGYSDPTDREDNIALGAAYTSMPFGASVAYDKYVTVKAWGSITSGDRNGLVELQLSPVDGVRVQAAYGFKDVRNNLQVSALADVKALLKTEFDLTVSGQLIANTSDFSKAAYYAAVTGGYKAASGYAEYVNKAGKSEVNLGVGYKLSTEKLPVSLSAGASLSDFDALKVGASVAASTSFSNITTQLKVGCEDFNDFQNKGYVRFATLLTF